MNSFRAWYLRNQVQITWFVVGWLGLSTVSSLVNGDYVGFGHLCNDYRTEFSIN